MPTLASTILKCESSHTQKEQKHRFIKCIKMYKIGHLGNKLFCCGKIQKNGPITNFFPLLRVFKIYSSYFFRKHKIKALFRFTGFIR